MHIHYLEKMLEPQEFAVATGVRFRGLTISQNDDGYNLIFRGTRRSGEHVYAMTHDAVPLDGLKRLLAIVTGKGAASYWHKDKYA